MAGSSLSTRVDSPCALDVAWAAGFFDGEGSIQVLPVTQRPRAHRLKISAVSTTPEPIFRLARVFGGFVGGPYKNKGKRRDYLTWSLDDRSAKEALRLMLPHLTVKRSQADAVLAFPSNGARRCAKTGQFLPISDTVWKQREAIRQELFRLRQ